jgi:phage shock protein A
VSAVALLATLLAFAAAKPFDRSTLTILTSQLRSNAREGGQLAQLLSAHVASRTFGEQHARQLGEHVTTIANSLRNNRAVALLEPARHESAELAQQIDNVLSALATDSGTTNDNAAELDRLCERIDVLQRAMPGG